MSKQNYEVRFTVVAEVVVDVRADDAYEAEEVAAKLAEELLSRHTGSGARIYGSVDGLPADSVKVQP